MLKLLILSCGLFFLTSSYADDFSCPTSSITSGSGHFPPNTNNLTQFPSNYFCMINFTIPVGSTVKLTIEAVVNQTDQDSLIVVDSLGRWSIFQYDGGYFYAAAKTAQVAIQSDSGTAKYWFSYEYIDITKLKTTQLPIGSPFALNFDANTAYTISTSINDKVVLHADSPVSRSDDIFISSIQVYDGPDVNSPYIGTLYSFIYSKNCSSVTSSGNSLTLVNLYGTVSQSFGLANKLAAISSYEYFVFYAFSSEKPVSGQFVNILGSAAYTFFSSDTDGMIISDLKISDHHDVVNQKTVTFTPQTPSTPGKLSTTLSYSSKTISPQMLPQIIPTNLITMVSNSPNITLKLASDTDSLSKWIYPYPGRSGTIFSPSLWTSGATPSYSWKFEAPTPLQFTFNIQTAVVTAVGEQLTVEIGSSGSAPFTTSYNHSVSNPGVRVANGTYMLVYYDGIMSTSNSIITFQMDDPNGSVTLTSTTSTMPTVQTSTKNVNKLNVVGIFIMVLMYTLNQ